MKTYRLTYYRLVDGATIAAPRKWIKEELEISLVDKSSAQDFLDKKFPFNKTRLINVEKVRLKSDTKKEAYYTSKENKRNKCLKKAEDYKAKRDKKHAKQLAYDEKKENKKETIK